MSSFLAKRLLISFGLFIGFGLLAGSAHAVMQEPALRAELGKRSQVAITHLANEGFLLQWDGKKVLVDSLFDGIEHYAVPAPEVKRQLVEADGRGNAALLDVDFGAVVRCCEAISEA